MSRVHRRRHYLQPTVDGDTGYEMLRTTGRVVCQEMVSEMVPIVFEGGSEIDI